jgi:hypothetical protein
MDIRHAALIFVAGVITASCSEKSPPGRDNDAAASETPRKSTPKSEPERTKGEDDVRPGEDMIAEDCVAFVRSTKVVPAQAANTDCPGCPASGAEALAFRHMKTDAVSCSGDTCNVVVTIRAVFNPSSGERLAGGLTAWIPPELRSAYLSGRTPSGEQAYRVQITYKRRAEGWRAVEFDRAPVE